MFIAIARFFGWDKASPIRSPVAAKPSRPASAGRAAPEAPAGQIVASKAPVVTEAAHDKSKAAEGSDEVKPAMAGMPASSFSLRESRPGAPPRGPGEDADAASTIDTPLPSSPTMVADPNAGTLTDASSPTPPSVPGARSKHSQPRSRKPSKSRGKDRLVDPLG